MIRESFSLSSRVTSEKGFHSNLNNALMCREKNGRQACLDPESILRKGKQLLQVHWGAFLNFLIKKKL